jgi:fructose-1,6-bisphosphatase/inositol monophosphatase family enzyme
MFSLGLVIDGKSVLGVVYDPFLKRMYEGMKGKGSYCDGKRLHVSKSDLANGIIAVSGSARRIQKLQYIVEINKLGASLATFSGGVYKACLVARGRFVGYVEHGINAHDLAAAQVIVEEAGGKITGLKGNVLDYSQPFKDAIVSNGKVHDQLVKLVNDFPLITK